LLDIVKHREDEWVVVERVERDRKYCALGQEGYLYKMTWMSQDIAYVWGGSSLGKFHSSVQRFTLVHESNMPTYSRSMSIEEGLVHPNEKVRKAARELSNA
jgi:hypothetical protein